MSSADRMAKRPDGVVLVAASFIVAAVAWILAVAFARSHRSVSPDRITIDLRQEPSQGRPFSSTMVPRMSRYESRSANLPHLGDDATSVLRSLESLRP
jgi:hypothetical protein